MGNRLQCSQPSNGGKKAGKKQKQMRRKQSTSELFRLDLVLSELERSPATVSAALHAECRKLPGSTAVLARLRRDCPLTGAPAPHIFLADVLCATCFTGEQEQMLVRLHLQSSTPGLADLALACMEATNVSTCHMILDAVLNKAPADLNPPPRLCHLDELSVLDVALSRFRVQLDAGRHRPDTVYQVLEWQAFVVRLLRAGFKLGCVRMGGSVLALLVMFANVRDLLPAHADNNKRRAQLSAFLNDSVALLLAQARRRGCERRLAAHVRLSGLATSSSSSSSSGTASLTVENEVALRQAAGGTVSPQRLQELCRGVVRAACTNSMRLDALPPLPARIRDYLEYKQELRDNLDFYYLS